VMMECGQPLHAFDFAKLRGREIRVREARKGEMFHAIDHKSYALESGMCVIADAQVPVALAGVMGGEFSEVSAGTTELLIESAEFSAMSIRTTARKLSLHSASSYRFERTVDRAGVDWASRRCCELILEIAGGELAAGSVTVGLEISEPDRIALRLSQLQRILGIQVSTAVVRRILTALGNNEQGATTEVVEVTPPTWRRDLTREVDLIEEIARIHGYDKIPEDVAVPMCPSFRRDEDRVLSRVRGVLIASGFDEAFTASVVPAAWCPPFTPWTSSPPLVSGMPMLKGADHLRVSLIPSLLEARRVNEAVSNPVIELFEAARIYLPRPGELPQEQWTLGVTSGAGFATVKGVIESLLESVHSREKLEVAPAQLSLLDPERSCELRVGGQVLGFVGEVTPAGQKQFGLRGSTTIAELSLDVVSKLARLIPQYSELSPYPAIARDLNLIVDEEVRWSSLAATVREAGGKQLESLVYRETYRDAKKDGVGKKRVLLSCTFRSQERTFTSEEADQIRDQIVAACGRQHSAKLLA
jgi:phenylalanyl-tRNA synthetase beta chain